MARQRSAASRGGQDGRGERGDDAPDHRMREEAATPRPAWGFHAAAMVVGLVASGFCFREFVVSRGGLIAGDSGDARLTMALLEHWYNAFRGLDDWLSPPFFFP